MRDSHNVQGPEIKINKNFPESLQRQRLTVVHITLKGKNEKDSQSLSIRKCYFSGVITKNARRRDVFLSFREPAFRSKPSFRLCWRWWHVEEGGNADDKSH